MRPELIYLAGINILTFIVFGADKYKARHHRYRIPENTLMCLTAIGGGAGALAGMQVFRHKTKHLKFRLGVPVILAAEAAVLLWYFAR